ncbi:Phosphotransferase system, mannose/fructose-specific component IIA [Selenomonas ruminantium]|uniref:Phosphotransferase system, mannose/fructose-specific component IIA n=1 Tax=Selenomonas ruminantium TaxID=971 RepID=A0A1M6VFV4_SELRU|nr:PTS EIIA protein [Selenomonas ruminantium]SHK80362.1 Phosphotransferase system, mannose/fructose-specific component IIA [Selenomonas ruminantium]
MKTIIVSNTTLASALKESLAEYIYRPACAAFCFAHPAHQQTAAKLNEYLQACEEQNPHESYLILADAFASTAYNETALLLERLSLQDRAVIYTGASLPMLLQLYDEDESATDMELWKKLQPILQKTA